VGTWRFAMETLRSRSEEEMNARRPTADELARSGPLTIVANEAWQVATIRDHGVSRWSARGARAVATVCRDQ